MKKLNLGSGYLPLPDYINVDLIAGEPNFGVDLVHDITKLKEVYEENSIDEIFAKDSLEHISWRIVPQVLKDWASLLKEGGVLKIRVPDLDRMMDDYFTHRNDKDNRNRFGRTVQLIFGDQNFTENNHLCGFRNEFLCEDLEKMGLRIGKPVWYDGGRDLRISAIKGTAEPLVTLDHPDYEYKVFSRPQLKELFKNRNARTD